MPSFVSHFLAIAILVASLTGCATTLKSAADSWIGAPVEEFIVMAGVPSGVLELQDKRVAYTWLLPCEFTFVAREGLVQSWSAPRCASFAPIPGKWKRLTR